MCLNPHPLRGTGQTWATIPDLGANLGGVSDWVWARLLLFLFSEPWGPCARSRSHLNPRPTWQFSTGTWALARWDYSHSSSTLGSVSFHRPHRAEYTRSPFLEGAHLSSYTARLTVKPKALEDAQKMPQGRTIHRSRTGTPPGNGGPGPSKGIPTKSKRINKTWKQTHYQLNKYEFKLL